ncbi:Hypothetical protein SRAE_2000498700 [Strongyloides ratti]|uniref:Uncharacterized protein n=1 Tax=Strongyloides ratti TaxID=34506 RepID=A0A090LQ98_STRRB|nr:Hypothetical protein SRAE_2000498700 [Strongyloides ratti]CEF70354.2 Hypothetical protein SRAE_2000498700 [Strongyloides ratti]
MKYLIPSYFILFISIITIFNVYSTTKASKKFDKKWEQMTAPVNGTMMVRLGKKGVEFHNNQHSNETKLIFVNVTEGLKRGKKAEGTKKLKLKILVTKSTSDNRNRKQYCQRLRVIFNVTKEGKKVPIRSELFKKILQGECIIPKNNKNAPQKKKI